jgi:prepilin-type N-terminal cleavage/methylation domain-containing protein
MFLYSLTRWHWALIGLLVGLALGWVRLADGDEAMVGGEGFVSQVTFERELRSPPLARDKPLLAGITIYPANNHDLVTMRRLGSDGRYRQAAFAAPRPYRPLNSTVDASDDTIANYLTSMASGHPNLTYRVAWWAKPAVTLGLWSAGGMVVIGGIWPTLLGLLVGAGFGRKRPEDDYDLSRFNGGPEQKAAAKKGLSPEDEARILALEQEMLRGLREQTDGAPAPAPPTSPKPVRNLGQPAEPIPMPQRPEDEKDFFGEFYPVAHPHHDQPTGGGAFDRHLHSNERGFTLVEVLVVLGIIAVLMSLLMPAITLVRRQSEATKCASNLRQLGMALQMYANSNKGWMPDWSAWHTYPDGQGSDDAPGLGWTEKLQPYFVAPDNAAYNCPSFRSQEPRINYFLAAKWSGVNGHKAMRFADVTMSSRFVLSGDKTQRGLYPPSFGTNEHLGDDCDPDDFGDGLAVMAWPWQQGGFWMHKGGNNVLFDDLHVAMYSRYDRTRMTFHPKKMLDWGEVTRDEDALPGAGSGAP